MVQSTTTFIMKEDYETPLIIRSFVLLFIPQFVLRQTHSLFQSQFSTECSLVFTLFVSITLSFP